MKLYFKPSKIEKSKPILKEVLAKLACLCFFGISASCGVKGDPQPPSEPVTLGRGHTDFKTKVEKLNEKRKALLKKEEIE